MRGSRLATMLLLGILVLLVNAPLVRSVWGDVQLSRNGVEGQVAVLDSTVRQEQYFLAVDLDPARVVRVEEPVYDAAVATGQVGVRRLPGGSDDRARVDGQVRSPAAYITVAAVDLALLAGVLLFVRVRPQLRPDLVMRANSDLSPTEPGAVLHRVEHLSYVVAGVVSGVPEAGGDGQQVVLDLGDRKVRVVLDGHRCPVPPGDTARVTGVMIA